MLQVKSRSLVGIATLFCSVVGDAPVEKRAEKRAFDVFDYVDPLIRTIDRGMSGFCLCIQLLTKFLLGHVFPRATLPFGEPWN